MKTVWKYEVEPDLVNQVYDMPIGAKIVSFGLDGGGRLSFWAIVEQELADMKDYYKPHTVSCIGTGWEGAEGRFIGTVTKGGYVWHLFDLGESS